MCQTRFELRHKISGQHYIVLEHKDIARAPFANQCPYCVVAQHTADLALCQRLAVVRVDPGPVDVLSEELERGWGDSSTVNSGEELNSDAGPIV